VTLFDPLTRIQSLQHLKELIEQQQNSYRTLYITGMIMEDAVMAPEAERPAIRRKETFPDTKRSGAGRGLKPICQKRRILYLSGSIKMKC
jgi:hypothetical protein